MYKENPNIRGSERGITPLQRILLHPESFDPDKLTVKELEQPDGTIFAKIPQIPNRITKRKKANSDGYYIELILSSHYDAETRQNRNKKVIIGEDISYFLKGMMVANDNYHEYFNKNGDLLLHIKAMMLEEERQKQKTKIAENKQPSPSDETEQSEEQTTNQPENSEQETGQKSTPTEQKQKQIPTERTQKQTSSEQKPQNTSQTPTAEEGEASEVQIRELKERQQALDRKEQELTQKEKALDELRKELENQQMVSIVQMKGAAEDHITLLRSILSSHMELIEAQAKRRPDSPMSKNQIRTINEVLRELRTCFQNSEIVDYLHLATEPDEATDTTATTYGEMSLLLNAYSSMLHQFSIGRLRMKLKFFQRDNKT